MKRIREQNINTAAEWDAVYGGPHRDEWTIWREPGLPAVVAAAIPHSAHVMNLGSGNGLAEKAISAIRPDIRWSAADLSSASVEYLRGMAIRDGVKFESVAQIDLNQPLPLADRSYDVAMCTEVLEHLEHPEATARELMRIARQLVIVSVPYHNATDTPYHLWSLSQDDLRAWFHGAKGIHFARTRAGAILWGFVAL